MPHDCTNMPHVYINKPHVYSQQMRFDLLILIPMNNCR